MFAKFVRSQFFQKIWSFVRRKKKFWKTLFFVYHFYVIRTFQYTYTIFPILAICNCYGHWVIVIRDTVLTNCACTSVNVLVRTCLFVFSLTHFDACWIQYRYWQWERYLCLDSWISSKRKAKLKDATSKVTISWLQCNHYTRVYLD